MRVFPARTADVRLPSYISDNRLISDALCDAQQLQPKHCSMSQRRQSSLEGNESTHRRIREAVLSGFDVTRELILESWVVGNRDDHVVPAIELIQPQLVYDRRVGMEKPRGQVACIGIEYANFGCKGADIRDFPAD